MSPGIGENDFNTKLKNGQKFLADGDRLKVTVRFRGREMAHTSIGEKLLKDFAAKCAEIANLDKDPKLEAKKQAEEKAAEQAVSDEAPAKETVE